MSMTDEERATLVRLELEKAHDTFEEIEILRQAGKWNGAANRVYYSVFHAVNALFMAVTAVVSAFPVVASLMACCMAVSVSAEVQY